MVLEVVAQHLEDHLAEGEEIFVCFEVLILLGKPIVEHLDIDPPNNVVEEPRHARGYVLQNAHDFQVNGFARLHLLYDRGYFIQEFQELKYLPGVFHRVPELERNGGPSNGAGAEGFLDVLNF